MKQNQRRWTAIILAAVALVVVGLAISVYAHQRQLSDCAKARDLNSYNKRFHDEVAGPQHGPTDVGEYRQWAADLHQYAADITDPQLRAKADVVTGLADQYVELLPQLQADLPADTDTQPPSSAPWQKAGRISNQFNDAVGALAQACPA